jgi:TonB family protein
MIRRLICATGCLLLAGAVCSARQEAAGTAVAPSGAAPEWNTAANSAALDAFVAQISQQITSKHLKIVVVIGAVGGDAADLTRDGWELGDEISTALTKQSNGFQVIDRAALRDFVKKNGVSGAMGCLLLVGAICGARQTPTPIASPEMDALAAKLTKEIGADKAATVVVVGGGDENKKVSELGVSLRDGLNDALARRAKQVQVMSTSDLCALVKRNRVSQGMVYNQGMADWIAAQAHADAVVTVELGQVTNGRAEVTAQLVDERKPKIYDKAKKAVVPYAQFQSSISLTETQANSASREYHEPLNIPDAKYERASPNIPKCSYCPNPSFSEEARRLRIQGPVSLLVTVRPDGMLDDIEVTKSLGHGLDGKAVETIATWKFQQNVDGDGRPVVVRFDVQVQFQLY